MPRKKQKDDIYPYQFWLGSSSITIYNLKTVLSVDYLPYEGNLGILILKHSNNEFRAFVGDRQAVKRHKKGIIKEISEIITQNTED